MHSGGLSGSDDGSGIMLRLKAGDVLGHRAIEQLNVLRQVSDVAAEVWPLFEGGTVNAHLAACRLPNRNKSACQ